MKKTFDAPHLTLIGTALCFSFGLGAAGCGVEPSNLADESADDLNPETYVARASIEEDKVVTRIYDLNGKEITVFIAEQPDFSIHDAEISLSSVEEATLNHFLETQPRQPQEGEIGTTTRAYWSGGHCWLGCHVGLYKWVYEPYPCIDPVFGNLTTCFRWVQYLETNSDQPIPFAGSSNQCNSQSYLNARANDWKNMAEASGEWTAFPGSQSCRNL